MRFIGFIVTVLFWQTAISQPLYKATEDYYRINPFKSEFSQFLNNLISDPNLVDKDINKKTDSTLFFLQGLYPSYSPFFFPALRCKIILAEQQEYIDSTQTNTFNYFVYQLIGYAKPGDDGLKDIKQEYDKLKRRLKKGLDVLDQRELKRGNEQTGDISNYTYKGLIFYPLTIAWATSTDRKENIIALTIRFFVKDNKAYLPIPPDSP